MKPSSKLTILKYEPLEFGGCCFEDFEVLSLPEQTDFEMLEYHIHRTALSKRFKKDKQSINFHVIARKNLNQRVNKDNFKKLLGLATQKKPLYLQLRELDMQLEMSEYTEELHNLDEEEQGRTTLQSQQAAPFKHEQKNMQIHEKINEPDLHQYEDHIQSNQEQLFFSNILHSSDSSRPMLDQDDQQYILQLLSSISNQHTQA